MPKQELLSEFDGLELSQEELDELTSPVIPQDKSLFEAEASLPVDERRRQKTLTTGRKLKILAELKNGMSADEICVKHRISKTVLAIIMGDSQFQEVTNSSYMNATKKIMANRFYQIADLCLSHVDTEKMSRMDPYKLVVAASIALDKARLIEGQSTENLSFRSLGLNIHTTLDQLKEKKQALLEMLATKQGQSGQVQVNVVH